MYVSRLITNLNHLLIEHPAAFAAHLINRRRMSDRGQQKEEIERRGDAMDSRQAGCGNSGFTV